MDLFGLGIYINYEDKASTGLMRTSASFENARRTAMGMVGSMNEMSEKMAHLSMVSQGVYRVGDTLSSIGRGVMGALKGCTNEATSFQSELQQLKFITGTTGAEFERLRRVAVQTGIDTAFSPQEATRAMYELKSAGLSTNDMLKSLKATLDLVAVSGGKIKLGDGASLMASTLKKFNMDASESVRVANELSQATKVSNFHFEDFSAFMNSLQSAPSTLKRPLHEFLAVGGMLRNIGQGAAQAGSTVNGFGRQLVTLSRQMEYQAKLKNRTTAQMKFDAMKQMGLDAHTIWDSTGALRPLNEILTSLITQMAGMSDKKKAIISQTLFGDQAKNLLFAVDSASKSMLKYDEATGKYVMTTKDGKMDVNQMTEAIKNSNGVAKQGSDEILKTAWGINKLWEGSKQTFQILLGQTILPIIGKFIQGMTKVLNVVIAFLDKHPFMAKVLGLGTGLAGLFLLATGGVLKLMANVGMAIAGFVMFANTIGAFGMSFLGVTSKAEGFMLILRTLGGKFLNLFGIVSKGALVTAGLYFAWKTDFLGLRSIVTYFSNGVKTAFSEANQIVGMSANDFVGHINHLASSSSLFDKIILRIVQVKTFWVALSEAWNTNTLSDENLKKMNALGLMPLLNTIIGLKHKFEAFCEGFKEGWKNVSNFMLGLVKSMMKQIDKLGQYFQPLSGKVEDFNKTLNKADFTKWKDLGGTIAYVVSILGGLWASSKVISVITTAMNILGGALGMAFRFAGLVFRGLGLITSIVPTVLGAIGTIITAILGFFGIVVTLPAWLVGLIAVAITTIVVLIVQHWEAIKQFFCDIGNSIGQFFSDLWNSICEGVSGMASSVGEFFSDLWNSICEGASSVWNGICEALSPLINFFSGLFEVISGIIDIAWSVIYNGAVIWWELVKGAIRLAWEGIKVVFGPAVEFFCSVWQGICDTATSIWNSIVEVVSTVWNAITSCVSGAWNSICAKCVEAWNFICVTWNALVTFFKLIWDAVYNTVIKPVWDWICNYIKMCWDRVVNIWNKVTSFFSSVWNSVYHGVILPVWNAIVGFIKSAYEKVVSNWRAIVGFFSGVWNSVKSHAIGIWNAIVGVIKGAVGKVKSAWAGVKGFFSSIWSGIKESARALFDWLASKFSWVSETAKSISDAWSNMKAGVSAGIDKVKAGAKKMVGLSTGGYVKTQGIAMLHPNEVVVNAPLTRRLDEFLLMNQRLMAMPPKPIVQPLEPKKDEPKPIEFDLDKGDNGNNNDNKPKEPKGIINQYATNFFTVPDTNPKPEQPPKQDNNHYDTKTEVKFEEGSIIVKVDKGTEQDAEKLAESLFEKIKKKLEMEKIRNYEPI